MEHFPCWAALWAKESITVDGSRGGFTTVLFKTSLANFSPGSDDSKHWLLGDNPNSPHKSSSGRTQEMQLFLQSSASAAITHLKTKVFEFNWLIISASH